jgi:hypothetical protein
MNYIPGIIFQPRAFSDLHKGELAYYPGILFQSAIRLSLNIDPLRTTYPFCPPGETPCEIPKSLAELPPTEQAFGDRASFVT